MILQTVYKHWIVHLRAIVEGTQLNHQLPADDWQKMERMGIMDGKNITELGIKVLQAANAMEELKAKGIKLSW
jgi:hypothetical protein